MVRGDVASTTTANGFLYARTMALLLWKVTRGGQHPPMKKQGQSSSPDPVLNIVINKLYGKAQ